MPKQVITGRVTPSQKENIRILSETEGVTVGDLLEMALEMYIPTGISAREWQVQQLTQQIQRLEHTKEEERKRLDMMYGDQIIRLRRHLSAIVAMDRNRKDRICELIPRWEECHDLNHRRVKVDSILKSNARDRPRVLVEWYKPFGIEVTWEELFEHYGSYRGELHGKQD